MYSPDKAELIVKHLLWKQGEMNGLHENYWHEKEFFDKYTTTEENEKMFKEYGVDFIRKKLRCKKRWADIEMSHIILCYGLKVKK